MKWWLVILTNKSVFSLSLLHIQDIYYFSIPFSAWPTDNAGWSKRLNNSVQTSLSHQPNETSKYWLVMVCKQKRYPWRPKLWQWRFPPTLLLLKRHSRSLTMPTWAICHRLPRCIPRFVIMLWMVTRINVGGLCQTHTLFDKFLSKHHELHELYFSCKAGPAPETICDCGQGIAMMICHDCDKYSITCEECFIDYHHYNPLHWAWVWDAKWRFFTHCDISVLYQPKYAINMSSCKGLCLGFGPSPSPFPHYLYANAMGEDYSHTPPCAKTNMVLFLIVDCNGVHSTRVRFCWCEGDPDHVKQLMRLGLFPATVDHPEMAFTFCVLKQFQIAHLQGKILCYDFIDSLSHLIDGAFPFDVIVCTIILYC